MSEASLLRLLELARREIGADDARLELGGREPEPLHHVWVPLSGAWRVVAVFTRPPEGPEARRQRLQSLVAAFEQTSQGVEPPSFAPLTPSMRLDEELAALAERCGAVGAVVIDSGSPIVWGSSERRRGREAAEALLARAAGRVRAAIEADPGAASSLKLLVREEGFGCASRGFAGTYHVVLAFDHTFSELHAEGALLRALPAIERLVMALPPQDPGGGARVLRLPASLRPL